MLHVGRLAPKRPIGAFCAAANIGAVCWWLTVRFTYSSLLNCGPNRAVLGLRGDMVDTEILFVNEVVVY